MRVGISTCMIGGGKTGVAQYVFALLTAMLEHPDCPELTIFALENDQRLFEFVRERARVISVPERFRPALRNILWHQVHLPQIVRHSKLDLLHVPSYRRLLYRKPCRLVATIHDLAPFHLGSKYDPLRMFYGKVVARTLARRQDAIIAVSQHTADDILRFFKVSANRVQVILNGLDHQRFKPGNPAAARAEVSRRWELNRPFFLYVSRLEHPGKNHVRLIEVFSRFKAESSADWQLVFAGSDWTGAEAIHAAANACSVREEIRFLGFVPDGELPALYRAAGAVVYPSLFEGFGFPPVEAMACGCPVLASRRGALAEVVGDAAGVLEPDDVAQMQSAMTRMVTDARWREELRVAGLKNARRFNWAENARQVIECYRRAAQRRAETFIEPVPA